jgi:tRNA-2-methylthio-N6-dimethylallyladenosine synthase
MRRTYGRERYLDLVGRLRDAIPDLSLTTDIIVGFPGETDADFEDTLSLVEACAYDGAYTFVYSPRPGTEAAERLVDDVPAELKRERIGRLVEIVQETARGRAQRFVDTDREVLVEGPSRTDPSRLRGRLSQNITVNFTGTAQPGTLTTVRIDGATSTTLTGRELEVAVPA